MSFFPPHSLSSKTKGLFVAQTDRFPLFLQPFPSPLPKLYINCCYTISPDTYNGTSLDKPVFESVPQYFNQTFNSTNPEPFSGAHQIYTPATKNGTNTTMAWPFMPAGGLLIREPTYTVESNFDFQSLNLALNQGQSSFLLI